MDDKEKAQLMLDQLAYFQAQQDMLNLEKQALIDAIITDEIKAKISEINAEFADKSATVTQNISDAEKEIKALVLQIGETVKGMHIMAVVAKGRTSWDSKKLEGLAIAIPAVLEARTIGEPSVSLRKI